MQNGTYIHRIYSNKECIDFKKGKKIYIFNLCEVHHYCEINDINYGLPRGYYKNSVYDNLYCNLSFLQFNA